MSIPVPSNIRSAELKQLYDDHIDAILNFKLPPAKIIDLAEDEIILPPFSKIRTQPKTPIDGAARPNAISNTFPVFRCDADSTAIAKRDRYYTEEK